MKKITLLSVVGARPNFMKIAFIEKAIADHNVGGDSGNFDERREGMTY